jgi:hypothetical protein
MYYTRLQIYNINRLIFPSLLAIHVQIYFKTLIIKTYYIEKQKFHKKVYL